MTIKIISYNINGLRATLKSNIIINNIKKKNNTFENYIKKFDIVCLQEIKLSTNSLNILENFLPNEFKYKYYNIPTKKSGYAGVAILSKLEPLNYSTTINDNEGRYLLLEFNKFYLINIYFPNSGSDFIRMNYKLKFNKLIYNKIKILSSKKEVIILGDFNAIQQDKDIYNFNKTYNKLAGITEEEINDFNKFFNLNLINVFREFYPNKIQYSFFTPRWDARYYNKGILLDFILVSKKILKYIINIKYDNNIYSSDHIPIQLDLDDKIFN